MDGASLGVLEAVSHSAVDVWAGWFLEDRARVEQFIAAGRAQLDAERKHRGVLFSPDERAGAVLQSAINELVDIGVVDVVTLDTGLREARVDTRDIRWTRTLFGLRPRPHSPHCEPLVSTTSSSTLTDHELS